jgi:hypothetical protein
MTQSTDRRDGFMQRATFASLHARMIRVVKRGGSPVRPFRTTLQTRRTLLSKRLRKIIEEIKIWWPRRHRPHQRAEKLDIRAPGERVFKPEFSPA